MTSTVPKGRFPGWNESHKRALDVDQDVVRRFGRGMDFVTPASPRTACFGASYGRAVKRAGSYLVEDRVTRRFSPEEMLRLLKT